MAFDQDFVIAQSSHHFDPRNFRRIDRNYLWISGNRINLFDWSINLQTLTGLVSPDVHARNAMVWRKAKPHAKLGMTNTPKVLANSSPGFLPWGRYASYKL